MQIEESVDFKFVLEKIIKEFGKENVRYALMGGFALGLWGVGRATVDIDFLVDRDDLVKVDKIMHDSGYECKFKSENVSQYVSPLRIFGEVDFLHAFREIAKSMLSRAEEKLAFNGAIKIRVLKPEDIIGLKLQAIKNNPSRKETDMADIKSLLSLYKEKIDWELIQKYCRILEMDETYRELKEGME